MRSFAAVHLGGASTTIGVDVGVWSALRSNQPIHRAAGNAGGARMPTGSWHSGWFNTWFYWFYANVFRKTVLFNANVFRKTVLFE